MLIQAAGLQVGNYVVPGANGVDFDCEAVLQDIHEGGIHEAQPDGYFLHPVHLEYARAVQDPVAQGGEGIHKVVLESRSPAGASCARKRQGVQQRMPASHEQA